MAIQAASEVGTLKQNVPIWNVDAQARGRKVSLRVSSISPGIVETEFATVHSFGSADATDKYKQMKALEAVDVAQAVVYCLSAPDHVDTNDIQMRPVEQQT